MGAGVGMGRGSDTIVPAAGRKTLGASTGVGGQRIGAGAIGAGADTGPVSDPESDDVEPERDCKLCCSSNQRGRLSMPFGSRLTIMDSMSKTARYDSLSSIFT